MTSNKFRYAKFIAIVGISFCGLSVLAQAADHPDSAAQLLKQPGLQLLGNRFFTFNTVVRVNQIETSRDVTHGEDESSIHSPKEARAFRQAVEKGWPGARITWAFSWLALKDKRPNYRDLKKLVVSYHKKYGDEITFIPGGYFANMYNTRQQVNRDLHDGLQMVSDMVGDRYRPQSVIAGFLSAENLRYLAEEEGIHVCQGNIWSQYSVDNGDGEGSISYPYYPSREHFCKPAQGKEDFIDCVNLDGWTVDFLSAKYPGGRDFDGMWCGSRQGVGPIETVIRQGTEPGTREMLATTAAHFDKGFELNNFAWVTCIWELCLVEGRKIYGYKGRNGLDGLVIWFSEMRRRWPDAKCITQGEFGMLWREQFKNNDDLNYRFVQRGSGICGSDSELEIRWFMNKDFRLALLRNWKANAPEELIDFTRYDLKAAEPADPKPGQHTRNWSLMNRLNQKGVRPQDKPIPIGQVNADEQAIIKRRYPELLKGGSNSTEPSVTSRVNEDGVTEVSVRSKNGKVLKTYEVNLSKHHSPATEQTPALKTWESYKFGAFVCFNTNQFTGKELCKTGDPKLYNPTNLNVKSWVDVMKAASMKYAVLTTRHTSGFLLWDSPTTDHDVASSGNKTDVVKEFSDECRKQDIAPGLYYCMWGSNWDKNPNARAIILAQLYELAANYGKIPYFWIDMMKWAPKDLPAQEVYDLLKNLQPDTIVIMNQHIQDGTSINYFPTDILNGEVKLPPAAGHEPYRQVSGKKYYLPFEFEPVSQSMKGRSVAKTPYGPGCWFTYGSGRSFPASTPFPPDKLYKWIKQAYNQGASNVLLSLAPDHSGSMREEDVKQLKQLGKFLEGDSYLGPPESTYHNASH